VWLGWIEIEPRLVPDFSIIVEDDGGDGFVREDA
jgi:hypothetical protein